jgi:hypothetical protein
MGFRQRGGVTVSIRTARSRGNLGVLGYGRLDHNSESLVKSQVRVQHTFYALMRVIASSCH